MYQTTVLDNGLKIATAYMPAMQSMCLGFWVKTGGRYETKELAGISHFLEHLLFEETKNRTSKQIKQAIEGIGGSLNGFTGEEMTCFLVKILSRHLDLSVEVLSDMLLNAALSDVSIEKERSVITEEIKMYLDLPGHYVIELLNELMWPGQPLGMFLTGTAETVGAIKKQDLLDYKNKFYIPNNMIIVLAGPIKHDIVVRSCSRFFEKLPRKQAVYFKPVELNQKTPRSNLHYKETEQIHIAMGVPAVSVDDPDRFAVNLMHILLGANMSSRLFQEIREKRGLAYEISTGVKKYKDAGVFVVSAGVRNEKFSQAVEVILKELNKIKRDPPDKDELKRAKEFYSGQTLMALEDTADHMIWLGEQVTIRDKFLTAEEILKNIDKITSEDICRVASKFFKSQTLNIAAIGPVTDKDKTGINKIMETLG